MAAESHDLTEVNVGQLLRRLEPGKHFVGLWTYHRHSEPLMWFVTFINAQGELGETSMGRTPEEALLECERLLNGA